MRRAKFVRNAALALVLASGAAATAQSIDSTFTYQGYLEDNGEPVNSPAVQLIVQAYSAAVGGVLLGADTISSVDVVDGVFSVPVDLGSVFEGDRVWLRVGVALAPGGSTQFLSPRQEVTAAPYAGYAKVAETANVSLDDAYENGRTIDANVGEVAIENSAGSIFSPATLRVGTASGGAPGGRVLVTSPNGVTAVEIEALGSSNSGNVQIHNATGTPVITAQRDVNGGGYFNVYRRDGSGLGSAIGFEVNGSIGGGEDTQVTVRGEEHTIFFATQLSGDATVQLPNDAINATEMLNEPGVASEAFSGSVTLSQNTATIDNIISRTINCPTDGYVLAIATAEVSIDHKQGVSSTANFGLSTLAASLSSTQDIELRLDNALPDGLYDAPVTVHGLFPVSAGARTIYFNGDQNSLGHDIDVLDSTLTCVFFPTAYGTADSSRPVNLEPDLEGPYFPPMTDAQIADEQVAAMLQNERRVASELEAMRRRIGDLESQLSGENR